MSNNNFYNPRTMILMIGIPGSGKSTKATAIREEAVANLMSVEKCSADDFFMTANGIYNFDRTKLFKAHSTCQGKARKAMQTGIQLVIIDNTNINMKDRRDYLEMAKEYGYTVVTEVMNTPLEVCLERNNKRTADRKVPEDVVKRMYESLQASMDGEGHPVGQS